MSATIVDHVKPGMTIYGDETFGPITTVVRVMQWRMLASLCYLLDDPGTLESDVEGVAWGLFQLDQDEQPVAAMRGLHESVLEADPTGREMRPADEDEFRVWELHERR